MSDKVIKHIEHTLLSVDNVIETIFDEFENDKNIIYNIWKDNEIIAVMIPYDEKKPTS